MLARAHLLVEHLPQALDGQDAQGGLGNGTHALCALVGRKAGRVIQALVAEGRQLVPPHVTAQGELVGSPCMQEHPTDLRLHCTCGGWALSTGGAGDCKERGSGLMMWIHAASFTIVQAASSVHRSAAEASGSLYASLHADQRLPHWPLQLRHRAAELQRHASHGRTMGAAYR